MVTAAPPSLSQVNASPSVSHATSPAIGGVRYANGAARVYTSLATLNGAWTLLDVVLQAYVEQQLGVSPAGASDAPAPPRH